MASRPLTRAELIALVDHFAGSPYADRLEQIAAHDAAQREIIDAQARENARLAAPSQAYLDDEEERERAAPPASDAVREAAEAVCERLCGGAGEAYYRKVAPGLVADIEAMRAALRATASHAPGSEAVREAEAVLAEARDALDEIRRRSTDKLAGGIAASFLGAHPRTALRGGQKGGE